MIVFCQLIQEIAQIFDPGHTAELRDKLAKQTREGKEGTPEAEIKDIVTRYSTKIRDYSILIDASSVGNGLQRMYKNTIGHPGWAWMRMAVIDKASETLTAEMNRMLEVARTLQSLGRERA